MTTAFDPDGGRTGDPFDLIDTVDWSEVGTTHAVVKRGLVMARTILERDLAEDKAKAWRERCITCEREPWRERALAAERKLAETRRAVTLLAWSCAGLIVAAFWLVMSRLLVVM